MISYLRDILRELLASSQESNPTYASFSPSLALSQVLPLLRHSISSSYPEVWTPNLYNSILPNGENSYIGAFATLLGKIEICQPQPSLDKTKGDKSP